MLVIESPQNSRNNMARQNTIRKPFEIEGTEPYGGNLVKLNFYPTDENSGIVFRTPNGDIKSNIYSCSEYKCSLFLKNGPAAVLHVEHMLAALYSYGVDNTIVQVQRIPTPSFKLLDKFGLATSIDVIPNFKDRTLGLCEKLDGNIQPQNVPRKLLRLYRTFGDLKTDKLMFEPMSEDGLIIRAITDYPLLGEQTVEIKVDADSYKNEISESRPYAKHYRQIPSAALELIASLCNPSFGIGHGFNKSNIFIPPRDAQHLDETKEIYKTGDEPARHTIEDRLGAISLLPGRLNGIKITAKFSGHANDLRVLKILLSQFV